MTTSAELVHEIEKLSPAEKVQLVDTVIRDIIPPVPEVDKAWAAEASTRWNAYKKGEIKSIPYAEVMAKYKK